MQLHRSRALTVVLLFVLLTQTSCCTFFGYVVGHAVDTGRSDTQSLSPRRAAHRKLDTPMVITLRDGTVVNGVLVGAHRLRWRTEDELRSLYAAVTGQNNGGQDSGGARVPMPGDTLLATTATLRGWARFARFETVTPHGRSEYVDPTKAAAVFELGAARVKMPLPVASLVSVQWADSTVATGADLVRFLSRGVPSHQLPAERQVLYIETSPGDTVAVQSGEVSQVFAPRGKDATAIGTWIGVVGDVTLVTMVLVAIDELGHSYDP